MKSIGVKWLKEAVDYCWKYKQWDHYLCAVDSYLFAYRQCLSDHNLEEPKEQVEYDSNEDFNQLVMRDDREHIRLKKVLQSHFNVVDVRIENKDGVISFQGVIHASVPDRV